MPSAGIVDPLRKRRLLSTFSVNAHLLRVAYIGYLVIWAIVHWCQLYSFVYQAFWMVPQRGVVVFVMCNLCAYKLLSPWLGATWSVQRLSSPAALQRTGLCAQMSFWYKPYIFLFWCLLYFCLPFFFADVSRVVSELQIVWKTLH